MSTNLVTENNLDVHASVDHEGTIYFQFDHALLHTKSMKNHEFRGYWSGIAAKEYVESGEISEGYWSRPSVRHGLKGSNGEMRNVYDWGARSGEWTWLWNLVKRHILPALADYFQSDNYKRDLQDAQQIYYRSQIRRLKCRITGYKEDIERDEKKIDNFRKLLIGDE